METQKTMTYFGNEVAVTFPNIGQYIEIERLKTVLSEGRYPVMAVSPLDSTRLALSLIDAIAYGSQLMGNSFLPPLGVVDLKDILNISMSDDKVQELIRWYSKEYAPFHNSIEKRKDRPAEESPLAKMKSEEQILSELTEGTEGDGTK